MSQPPAAPAPYAYPPTPAQPLPPKKKKRGCCSCCLWFVLILVVLSVSFVVAAQFIMRAPSNPVKEEYESIPDYFSRLNPELQNNQYGTQELRKAVGNSQFAIRNSQSRNNHEPHEPHERANPQSEIRNPQLTQWSGGAHV